jgi:hypothetical protein
MIDLDASCMPAFMLTALLGACATEGDPPPDDANGASSSTSGGHGGQGGDAGVGGAGGEDSCPISDPCEAHTDHASCCADPVCGWHDKTGHSLHGIPSCVSKTRVCEAGDMVIRECTEGTTCVVEGSGQGTEDDCMLPPDGSIYLPGRGICACE